MFTIPFVLVFFIVKMIKGIFVDDGYKSSSKFIGSSSSNKPSIVNLSKNSYSNSSSRSSSSSSKSGSSSTDYLFNTALLSSSYDYDSGSSSSYDSSSSSSCGSSSSYDSSSSSSYDSGSSCDSGG
nr:RNA-binding protein of the Puf family, translational repressor [Bacillus wiedmannii]